MGFTIFLKTGAFWRCFVGLVCSEAVTALQEGRGVDDLALSAQPVALVVACESQSQPNQNATFVCDVVATPNYWDQSLNEMWTGGTEISCFGRRLKTAPLATFQRSICEAPLSA